MKKISAFLFVLSFYYTSGQSLDMGAKLPPAYDSASVSYYSNQGKTLAIYSGRVFYGYPGMIGHAFFPEEGSEWQRGSILYDDTWYYNASLMFDIFKDEVLILQLNGIPVRLLSERVQKFTYKNITFVRLQPDKDKVLKTGFYQQLVEGDATILVRRSKQIDEKIEGFEIERKFVSVNQYYLLKDGNYYSIHTKKALLSLLKVKKQSIVQHLKKQQLKFKKNKEKAVVEMATYYNQSRN